VRNRRFGYRFVMGLLISGVLVVAGLTVRLVASAHGVQAVGLGLMVLGALGVLWSFAFWDSYGGGFHNHRHDSSRLR
jgi:hypothetical protein